MAYTRVKTGCPKGFTDFGATLTAAVAPGFKGPIVWKLSPAIRTASVKLRFEWFSMVPTRVPPISRRWPVRLGAAAMPSVANPPSEKAVMPAIVTPLAATSTRIPGLFPKPLFVVAIGLISSRSPPTRAW